MPITRTFLEFTQPALTAAAGYLVDRFAQPASLDLRDVVVVVPGARAGRRLLEILVDRAEADSLTLTPPHITTVGKLPELLYQAKKPFADDLVQQLAWAHVLRQLDAARLAPFIAERPDDQHAERWLELGRLLQTLHRELASDGLDFADVVTCGNTMPGFSETERWRTLTDIQKAYHQTLDGLGLWDRQTARLFAIEHRECHSDRPIVLVAAVDLNRTTRQMLDQVADQVSALIHAPDSWAKRFDEHGCLIPSAWHDAELDIDDQRIVVAEHPLDQSDQVARCIAQFDGQFRAEEMTVGLPDERIVPQLRRQLDECRLPNRYGPGQPLAATSVYRMLGDLAAYLQSGRYDAFADLVRQPDIEAWLMQSGVQPGWIEELDDYYNQHLPRHIDGKWLGESAESPRLRDAHQRISRLTRGLRGNARRLGQWLQPIGRIVLEVYKGRTFDLENEVDRRAWKACSTLQDTLDDLAQIPANLMPDVDGTEALNLLLDRVQGERTAPASAEAVIELVGWLELPLDDAPALIVTSFNEGFVPSSINADMFLPGGLRTALGLDDNPRRYARDAYAVSTLLAPWRKTTFIVARRDANDDPLAPSRLLFAAPPDRVAQRALRFFDEPPKRSAQQSLAGGLVTTRAEFAFEVPRPQPLAEPITRMSVTSFKTYLACPYRFYLSRVLRLEATDDDALELDGAEFGSLAHTVLEQFGRSDARDATDPDIIKAELHQLLDQLVQWRFGKRPGTAVLVQIEQLQLRLDALARWQAEHAANGWRIEHAELSFSGKPAKFVVDDEPMLLSGRIDRIDVNQQTGERMVLDYKTSDRGDSPAKTHRNRAGEWLDLQLPLYRHLVRELGIDGPVDLGFIVLPKKTADVGLLLAEWNDAELEDADDTARNVVRQVRQQQFWPPAEPPPDYSEEFAGICLDGVFGRKILE